MLARIRKMQEEGESGFTLIELLIVMIIIGILAAIAIPTFLNQRKNAYNTAVKSDLKNAATAVESAAVDLGGDYTLPSGTPAAAQLTANASVWCGGVAGCTAPATTLASLLNFNGSDSVVIQVGAAAPTSTEYCLQGYNAKTGTGTSAVWFHYDKASGVVASGKC